MLIDKLRRLSYGWLLVQGLLAATSPERSIRLNARLRGVAFENADELEPKPWYVRSVRAAGVGMLATGGVGLLLEERNSGSEQESEIEEPNGPITVETDDV
jgi:hypothetical protein